MKNKKEKIVDYGLQFIHFWLKNKDLTIFEALDAFKKYIKTTENQ